MRILHTADWHLGRIFHNIHLTDDQSYILEQFVALAADTNPDVIVIAGDVYDRSVPPPEAVTLLNDVLSRILLDYRIPVIVTAGNHDSPERLGFGQKVLSRQNLHVVSQVSSAPRIITLEDKFGPVYFCPFPFAEPAVVREKLADSLAASHDQALADLVENTLSSLPAGRRIAIAHAFITGGTGSESERPLSIGGVATVRAEIFAPFNYVALGHLHQPQQVSKASIRYAGSLLKYSFSEASQRKSVSIIDIAASGEVAIEEVHLTPRHNVRCLQGYLDELMANASHDNNQDDYIMAIIKDEGAVFDPMGKLRQVYPNVLHLEKMKYRADGGFEPSRGDHRRQSEADLFSAFFAQAAGRPLSGDESETLSNLLNEFNRREREVIS